MSWTVFEYAAMVLLWGCYGSLFSYSCNLRVYFFYEITGLQESQAASTRERWQKSFITLVPGQPWSAEIPTWTVSELSWSTTGCWPTPTTTTTRSTRRGRTSPSPCSRPPGGGRNCCRPPQRAAPCSCCSCLTWIQRCKTFYSRNLQGFPLSWSVCSWQAFPS